MTVEPRAPCSVVSGDFPVPAGRSLLGDVVGCLLLFIHVPFRMGLGADFCCFARDQSIMASRLISCAGVRLHRDRHPPASSLGRVPACSGTVADMIWQTSNFQPKLILPTVTDQLPAASYRHSTNSMLV